MDIWADRSDLRENLPHPDMLWRWDECPLSPRIQQKLYNHNLIERVPGTEYWRTTRELWEYVQTKYGDDVGTDAGQSVLFDENLGAGRSDDRYLVSDEHSVGTSLSQSTFAGDVADDTRDDMAEYEKNKRKNQNKNSGPSDAPGQTAVSDYFPTDTPDGWYIVVRRDGHGFGVPTGDAY